MSSFWSAWIIVLTVISFILLFWVLFANRTRESGEKTTGHVYDGIEEYENPLPFWWFAMFVITLVFGIAYLIAYPGLGNFKGLLNWTQIGQYEAEMAAAEEQYGPLFAQYGAMPLDQVSADPKAMKMAGRLFSNNCAQCHGSDAKGGFGFPNLSDNAWLWGGSSEQVKASITNGRTGTMPGWQAALGEQGIEEVANYVVSLSGRPADNALAEAGKARYATFCVACHGVEGKGNTIFGAPDLTDNVWLYGGSLGGIKQSISSGRNGQMPAFKDQLSADKLHLLTAYVLGRSAAE